MITILLTLKKRMMVGWHFNSKKIEGNKISDEVLSNESKALFKACLKKALNKADSLNGFINQLKN